MINQTPENNPAFAVPAITLNGDSASGTNCENTHDDANTIKQVGEIKYIICSGVKNESKNKLRVAAKAIPIMSCIFLLGFIFDRWLYRLPKSHDTPNAIAK